MKKITFLSILCFMTFLSCQKQDNATLTPLPEATLMQNRECIFRFNSDFPVHIAIDDSFLFIINRKSEKCITAINKDTKSIVQKFANRQMGPNDAIDPEFIVNNHFYENRLMLTDVNSKRFLEIKTNTADSFRLESAGNFPADIFPSSNLNFCDDIIVGRNVSSNSSMFFIYDKSQKTIKNIDYIPFLEGLNDNINYYCATNLAANKEQNVIVAAMYKMDLIHFFDFDGKWKKSIKFTDNPVPAVSTERSALKLENGYAGVSFIYPTKHFFFIKRNNVDVEKRGEEYIPHKTSTIVKLNWEGEVVANYAIDKEIGFFCVDDSESELYVITHETTDVDEYFDIVKYNL